MSSKAACNYDVCLRSGDSINSRLYAYAYLACSLFRTPCATGSRLMPALAKEAQGGSMAPLRRCCVMLRRASQPPATTMPLLSSSLPCVWISGTVNEKSVDLTDGALACNVAIYLLVHRSLTNSCRTSPFASEVFRDDARYMGRKSFTIALHVCSKGPSG